MSLITNENDKPNSKNGFKETEHKDKAIYLKVSDETRSLIDKYKVQGTTISDLVRNGVKCYDDFNSISPDIHAIIEKYKEENEPDISFIERAIKYFGDHKNLDRDLWIRARGEMKMMLIGKTTFNQLIHAAEIPEDSLERPWHKNVAFDIILWYTGKPLKTLSIQEILFSIQKIWTVANYFHTIDVKEEAKDLYHLLFRHRQNKRYGNYWLGYFTEFFHSDELPFKVEIESQVFDESLSITVKVGYKK